MGKRDNADVDETDCETFLKTFHSVGTIIRRKEGGREGGERLNYLHSGRIRMKEKGIHSADTEGKFLLQGICS